MTELQTHQAQTQQINYNENDSLQNKIPRDSFNIEPKVQPINNLNPSNNKGAQSSKAIEIANPIELTWKNLNIDAFVKKQIKDENGKKKTITERRQILKSLSGTLKPGQFTAILGPSGCGKTTLLNFLSGRLVANNMEISGNLLLNGTEITDIDDYSNQIAYVMQDDILLATFTPTEAFKFSADLRLKQLNEQQKMERVMKLIKELGLTKCKDTKIGNAMIRGVSGGERKRTSIGVELLTNPAMLFLDEPTTGLDSSTALQVVELLQSLSHRGVNVVSTIHQPSSEIFDSFERLILICRGNIIYQGDAHQSVDYFTKLGHKCPDFSNPSDYFMKLMNEEGLLIELMQKGQLEIKDEEVNQQFEQRLDNLVTNYRGCDQAKNLEPTFHQPLQKNDDSFNVSIATQFYLLIKRSFVAQIRNPMDVLMKSVQMIIFALATLIVFQPLGDGLSGIQNRSGALFFLATMNAFSSIQGSIATFSVERPLFLRERLNKSYSVGPYFWGKNLAEFPFHLLYPILTIVITYYSIGLNDSHVKYFFILNAAMICTFFYGTSYGLLISVIIPKMEVAMALVPVLVIPFMVLGGFFVNTNNVPNYLKWIEYVSMFKYGFQAAALNEFDTVNFDCVDAKNVPCDPLNQLGIKETMGENFGALIALGVGFRVIAYLFMHLISTPKRPKLNEKKAIKA